MQEHFEAWPKMARLTRDCIVTEKIDGTNAQVLILEDGQVLAGSRTRMITPEADNYGFASWVKSNEDELREGLGVGRHFGEWWGAGIQRRYGLDHKRFSLFNTGRWGNGDGSSPILKCGVYVVPTLYRGLFCTEMIEKHVCLLADTGSVAAPGFMQPEGVVIFHEPRGYLFKKTIEKDESRKGSTE